MYIHPLDHGARPGWRVLAPLALLLASACYQGGTTLDADDTTGATASDAEDTGGSSDADATGDDDDDDDDAEPPPAFKPGVPVMPRLTRAQYLSSIEALLGPELPAPPTEPDTNPYLFYNIGAASTTLSELGAQQYEEAADQLSAAVFADAARREALVGCAPASPTDECVAGFLAAFGRRVYRRPLTEVEQQRWLGFADELAAGDAWQGLRYVVAGMLQSPYFLYRVERGEPDPVDPSRRRYTSWEMASRVSFLLWNQGPDDELLDAAASGALLTDEGLRAQAERMLADERARAAVQGFFAQYLDLARLDGVTRDPERYPLYTPALIEAMRTELELLVDDFVHRRDADIRGIFSTRHTFVNDELAALYEVEAEGASPVTFVPAELPEDGVRAGLLTLGAFLTMNAHETYNSPTARGKYVRERVLCEVIPAPPADVDLDLDPEDAGEGTLRDKLEAHRENPVCASCHQYIDPPGFLFEHFDPIGAYRTLDNGLPIDASGALDGTELADARALAELLKSDERVGECIATQLYRHASGRREVLSEKPGLDAIHEGFAESGFRFNALLITLITSEAFRTVADEEVLP